MRLMGARIPESKKSMIIQKWLSGMNRDRIAAECGLSGGAVSSIIANWRDLIGFDLADQLREISIALRKRSLTPVECATALRFINIMENLGVNEDAFESFISEVYTRSVGIGLDPKHISGYLAELVAFWSAGGEEEQVCVGPREPEERPVIRTFSQIPRYFATLKEEKIYLENQILKLSAEVRDLNDKKSKDEHQLEKSLRDNAVTAQHLNWYSEVEAELHRS